MSSNSKAAKRQSLLSNDDKQVEVGSRERRGTEEDEAEYEKEESVLSVTSQLCIKPIENCGNLDKAVVLRRIRHRKRMNKVRAAVGAILSLPFSTNTNTGNASVQEMRWVDDAFAAL